LLTAAISGRTSPRSTCVLDHEEVVRPERGLRSGEQRPDVLLADVAYDPMLPDRVWIAYAGAACGVQLSLDGGDTWQDAGGQGLGQPLRLVLGIDGRSLYLATSSGLFRQRLDPATDGAMRDDDGLVMSARG
jgi:hypothetical protein